MVCFLHEISPDRRKNVFLSGKSGPHATCNLFFLWFGLSSRVGEFVGFIIIFTCFPAEQKLDKSQNTPLLDRSTRECYRDLLVRSESKRPL